LHKNGRDSEWLCTVSEEGVQKDKYYA
jgi:hypothetical protein